MSRDPNPVRLRIVSLNTWKNEGRFETRMRLMANELRALAPDVVCLQECFIAPALAIDVASALAAALDLKASQAPARAKLRLHGGAAIESTSGLAILGRVVEAPEMLALPDDPADGPRIALRARIGPYGLAVLNLHLTHLQDDRGEALRRRQIDAALAWADRGGPLVLCGDLNAAAASPALAPLFGRSDVDRGPSPDVDAPTLQGERPGAMRHYPAIDHVALIGGGGWRIERTFHALDKTDPMDGVFASDHAAIVADLERSSV